MSQIERNASLVAAVYRPKEVSALIGVEPPAPQGIPASRGFDLDDVRAEVTKDSGTKRSRQERTQLQHPDPLEGRRSCTRSIIGTHDVPFSAYTTDRFVYQGTDTYATTT